MPSKGQVQPGPKSWARVLRVILRDFLEIGEARHGTSTKASGKESCTKAEVLAQFHAAEYASERNSVDVWKTLQYALIPIIFVAWSLLVQIREAIQSVVFWWACAAVLPACYIAYQKAMVDALTGVLLIEERVRPSAIELSGTDKFWFHEPIYRKNVKPDAAYGWYWPPLLSFTSPLAVLAYRASFGNCFAPKWWEHLEFAGYGDLVGYVICCGAAWVVGDLSKQGLALNRRIAEQIGKLHLSWLKD